MGLLVRVLVSLGVLVATCGVLLEKSPEPAAAAPTAREPLRSAEVRALTDELVPRQLRQLRIPGAAVSVVADGRELFSRGYGLADVDARRAFDAESTTFHIDSVSKVLTATAVMQLVEQGRLDLNTDVNRYLTEFEVDNTYPGRPVTLAHLLTHTAGFEDPLVGPDTGDQERSQDLAAYLAANQPDRVRPPGEVHSYSDYGFELAGYLVRVRSGMPFEQYVEEHVFAPLGMTESRFVTAESDEDTENGAVGYTVEGGRLVEAERGYVNRAPSVGVVSTASDMATFMLAQLSGAAGDARILKRSTVRMMHRRQFAQTPQLPGLTFPLAEAEHAGTRTLGHTGEGPGSHSMLTLLPDRGVGLFVTYNGDGAGDNPLFGGAYTARRELRNAFVERLSTGTPPTRKQATEADLQRYAGTYRWTKFGVDDPARLPALLSAPADLHVTTDGRGGLTTSGFSTDPDGAEQSWYPIGPGRFRERGGDQELAFVGNEDGAIRLATTSSTYYLFVLERIAWYDSLALHLALGGLGLLLMLSTLGWPMTGLLRRILRRRIPSSRGARLARWTVAVTSVVLTGMVVSAGLAGLNGHDGDGHSAWLALPALAVVGVLASAAFSVGCWRSHWWSLPARVHHTAVTCGLVTVFAVAGYYDLSWLPT